MRPRIDKPVLDSWKADDEQIATFLEDVQKNKLNVESEKYWQFNVPHFNKYLTYNQFLEKINTKVVFIPMAYVEAMQLMYRHLPDRLRIIREEIFSHFQKLVANRESMVEYIKLSDTYMDSLENDIAEKDSKIESLDKEIRVVRAEAALKIAEAKNEALLKAFQALQPGQTPTVALTSTATTSTPESIPDGKAKKEEKKFS